MFVPLSAQSKKALDFQRNIVLKGISKVAQNPLPTDEGGYGRPLGNKQGINLSGLLKIKLLKLGIRIVYDLKRDEKGMRIIIIGVRADYDVYELAEKRIQKF
jgi:mRNA interferase RelE/StbE